MTTLMTPTVDIWTLFGILGVAGVAAIGAILWRKSGI